MDMKNSRSKEYSITKWINLTEEWNFKSIQTDRILSFSYWSSSFWKRNFFYIITYLIEELNIKIRIPSNVQNSLSIAAIYFARNSVWPNQDT